MQAIMLAAGKGSRLGKYTKNNTKCMLDVHGETLLERAIDALLEAGIKDFILVLGYKKDNVKKFIKEKELDKKINITYVDNDVYDTTNNIYSLYLAKDYLIQDDTILFVFGEDKNRPDTQAVDTYLDSYYKTVNIYKFSKEFSERFYLPFLESYIKAYGNNDYYELVLKVISELKDTNLYGLPLTNELWYEIDDCQDYDIVKAMFAPSTHERLELFHKRFGGYWRFGNIKDYCYLVNPYFPTEAMINKMKYFYDKLLFNYPSGQSIERICACRMFDNVSDDNILIGNGAAELINNLKYIVGKKIALTIPSFNEYVRCFPNSEITYINSKDDNYRLSLNKLKETLNKVDTLIVISPDNPSGSHLKYGEVIELLDMAKEMDKQVIFDESFIDFANDSYTLINDDILNKYPNLIVIKSISKSYGVPGLRLGVLASGNYEYLDIINRNMPVWNINSFAEYFLQIFLIYKKDYVYGCSKIKEERNRFYNELIKISELDVYDSEANYFMIKLNKSTANEIAEYLLDNNKILIKVLNGKNGFDDKEYIRIAVKTKEENDYFIQSIKEYYDKK